jgi:hypothetical protein
MTKHILILGLILLCGCTEQEEHFIFRTIPLEEGIKTKNCKKVSIKGYMYGSSKVKCELELLRLEVSEIKELLKAQNRGR